MAKAVVAVRGLASLDRGMAGAVVANTVHAVVREWRDRRVEQAPAVVRGPGRLLAVEPQAGGGVRCRFSEGELEVVHLAPDLVRVTWGPGDLPVPWATADGTARLAAGAGVTGVTVDVAGDAVAGCFLRPADPAGLAVDVAPDGAIRYRTAAGAVVRHELPPLRRGAARTARLVLRPGERICGLGEQGSPLDQRGTVHRLWNRDPGGTWGTGVDPLYCAVPVLVGLHVEGHVLAFYENPYDATVRVGDDAVELTFVAGMLRHYVAAGPLPRLLEQYTALTGRPPLPPRWALGYHHSRWGYRDGAEVGGVAAGFRSSGLPLSAFHLDIDHLDGYRVFTVDGDRFGDLPALASELAGDGTRLVAIVDPGVKEDPAFDIYREGVDAGHFVTDVDGSVVHGVVWPGRCAFPDFTDPETRRWWGGWYRRLADRGVGGVWHDMNEPTLLSLFGDRTLPRSARHAAEGRGGDHRECHNPYGVLMNRAGWEGLAAAQPDRRPFVLSRAGWAGGQRWAWHWTGDSESTWEGLAQQVPTVLGMGLSGLPYAGPDTGGFSATPGPELYVRWLELSVLLPFCRTHSAVAVPPREPWRFPEPERAAIGRLIRFRYRLLPYLYALAHDASRTGAPLVRPLWWSGDRPESGWPDGAWPDDAFLLGDGVLVAPVLHRGATTRRVVAPPGWWYRWRPGGSTGVPEVEGPFEGGEPVELMAPLGEPVLLVRGGTVLPLDDGWLDPAARLEDDHGVKLLAFHCFPGRFRTAAGRGYDDAGDGHGPSRLDRLVLSGGRLRWERDGDYPAPERVRVVVHGEHPADGTLASFGDLDLRELT